MDYFPEFMKTIARKPDFYEGVDRLLNVQRADKIEDPVFKSILQNRFDHYLAQDIDDDHTITGAQSAEPARLATGVPVGRPTTGFRQFSAVGSLLSINERQNKLAGRNPPAGAPIMIATDVVVERFELEPAVNPTHARVLHTSRGPLTLRGGKTNVILAAGAIPATTILLNSIKEIRPRAGKRVTSHFRSNIKARFKPDHTWAGLDDPLEEDDAPLEEDAVPLDPIGITVPVISACHVRGRYQPQGYPDQLQWHLQVNGAYEPVEYQGKGLTAEERALRSSRLFSGLAPDNGDTLTPEQLDTSEGYVIVCRLHFIHSDFSTV
jgi:hypothetical protein